jgi:hypothetical protein
VHAFGKRFSNWWSLALVPIALIASPILLMGFFMANNLAGAMFGPPAIWNRPWQTPSRNDLVGTYMELERPLDDNGPPGSASLTLQADGSMTVGIYQQTSAHLLVPFQVREAGRDPMMTAFVLRSSPTNILAHANPVRTES